MSETATLPPESSPQRIERHRFEIRGAAAQLMGCESPEVLLEGAAGTGKTRAALYKVYQFCKRYPGCRALICRQTRASLTESILVTFERDILWPGHACFSGDAGRAGRHSYDWPNGSTIVCGGLDNADRLFSTEWDIVYLAEATETTEDTWEKFARAMRSGKGPYHQRIADCNPGAPQHWLNQRAIAGKMVRLKSRHEDNPSVTEDYLNSLRNLSGHRRARLYEGRWVSAEGSVFPEFQEDKHVIPHYAWPSDWPVWVGYDPGYAHPCAVVFWGVAPNGQHFIIDEIHQSQLDLPELAKRIKFKAKSYRVVRWLDDVRGANQRTQAANGKTVRDQMRELGLTFSPWQSAEGAGKQAQVEAVRQKLLFKEPLQVFSTCTGVIGEFQSWSYKRDTDGQLRAGDDAYEDRNNDAMDALCGIVADNPTFKQTLSSVSQR